MVRGANAPVIVRTIHEQLAYEHKVLKGEAERKPVEIFFSNHKMLKKIFSSFFSNSKIVDPMIQHKEENEQQEEKPEQEGEVNDAPDHRQTPVDHICTLLFH